MEKDKSKLRLEMACVLFALTVIFGTIAAVLFFSLKKYPIDVDDVAGMDNGLTDVLAAVKIFDDRYVDYIESRNIDGIVSLYTSDAVIYRPQWGFIRGKTAIKAHLKAISAGLGLGQVDYVGNGTVLPYLDKTYINELYEFKLKLNGTSVYQAKGMAILKWHKDAYLVYTDILIEEPTEGNFKHHDK